mgnify:CR=1 FL=1
MSDSTLKYKIAFASIRGMSVELAQKMLDVIPDEEYFFKVSQQELSTKLQTKNKIIDSNYRKKLMQAAEEELKFIGDHGISLLYFTDTNFPVRLLNAPDAPILLYSKGTCNLNDTKTISIVGTRNATSYGTKFCETLIGEMAERLENVVIISGLAYGIDIVAHRAALANNIPTIAVLAHGLNTIYPAIHRGSAIEIIKHGGMLVTDYSTQDVVCRANFLARNRIVAGLSDCTIVIESAEKGGAMATANIAASYNRDVFALPGRINDQFSSGCNKLIRNNIASLITCLDDLVKAMGWKYLPASPRQKELFPELNDDETRIYNFIKEKNEIHINLIYMALKIPMPQLLSLLVDLEFKGVIASHPGNKYSIT